LYKLIHAKVLLVARCIQDSAVCLFIVTQHQNGSELSLTEN